MLIGILQFDLLIHGAESLKDKRRVVLSVKDRLHRAHGVSIAEIGLQDTLNAARIGLALVGSDGRYLGQCLDRITTDLRATPGAELAACSRQIIGPEDARSVEEPAPAGKDQPDVDLALEMLRRADGEPT